MRMRCLVVCVLLADSALTVACGGGEAVPEIPVPGSRPCSG